MTEGLADETAESTAVPRAKVSPMVRGRFAVGVGLSALLAAAYGSNRAATPSQQPSPASMTSTRSPHEAVLDRYCFACHNQRLRTGGLALDGLDISKPGANPSVWERVVAKLEMRSMPPAGHPRPDAATYRAVVRWLETEIDRSWAANPQPGRTHAVHRSAGRPSRLGIG